MCSDWELNPQPFSLCSNQLSHPGQGGGQFEFPAGKTAPGDRATLSGWGEVSPAAVLRVGSDLQLQHPLGACQSCQFSAHPDPLNQGAQKAAFYPAFQRALWPPVCEACCAVAWTWEEQQEPCGVTETTHLHKNNSLLLSFLFHHVSPLSLSLLWLDLGNGSVLLTA